MTTTINTSMEVRALTEDELNRVSGGMVCDSGYSVIIVDYGAFKMPMLSVGVNCGPGVIIDVPKGR
jgi:hypothetical protein